MIKVLFISQWYPHRYDKMFGLFVQKHAEAALLYSDVKVLYVHPDPFIKKLELVETVKDGLTEIIVYYPAKSNNLVQKVSKLIWWLNAYKLGFKHLKQIGFKPDLIHANVLTRTGVIALYQKIFYKTPYVITEHWSRYLPTRNSYNGFFRKIITPVVVKNASAIFPVSEILKEAMLSLKLNNTNYKIVENVVDNTFFEKTTSIIQRKRRILHISCFDEQAKNIKGIVRAIKELSQKRQDFELFLIGDGKDFQSICNYTETLNIKEGIIHFLGEKTSEEVANWLKNSDFMILFSNYETAGVVIAESLVCGKPVISTKVGAAPEYINEQNGILINIGDEEKLIHEMNFLLDHLTDFNTELIQKSAKQRFCYDSVGKKFYEEYKRILKT